MALKNAFENLGTESKQDGVISLLRAILKSTTYARSATDQLRVIADSGSTTAVTGTVTTSGAVTSVTWSAPSYYAANAPMSLDAREHQKILSDINLNAAMQRWTLS